MRSSKSRSRSKNNRNRNTLGNVVNRVFDGSGPEGKVRGTPQQIIDKYNQLARDAGLANDRVAAENFQQHAEHYLRMLAEATREQDQKREQQERENRERQAQRDRERGDRGGSDGDAAQDQGGDTGRRNAPQPGNDGDALAVNDAPQSGESGLVPTPEAGQDAPPERPRKPRRPRKPAAEEGADGAPAPAPRKRRRNAAGDEAGKQDGGDQPAAAQSDAPDAAE